MGQSNKPPTIVWATAPTAIIQIPPGPKILDGWVAGDIPPDGQVNWFWNGVSRAADYAVDLVAQASDSYVTAGLAVTPTAPPSSTDIRVAIGTAIADGQEVELTVAEIVPVGIAAGAAAVGTVRPVLISIDGTGTIIKTGYGSFPSDAAGLREVFTQMPDPSPQEARLAVVLVREPGQTVFGAADIVSVQQTQPISGGVIQDRSIRGISHLVPPLVLSRDSLNTAVPTRCILTMDLETKEGDAYPIGPAVPVDADLLIQVRRRIQLNALTSDFPGLAADITADFFVEPNDVTTNPNPQPFDSPGSAVVIEVRQAGSVILTASGDGGGFWSWFGTVPLLTTISPNQIEVYIYRKASQAATDYIIELSTSLGPKSVEVVTLPAT
jgi:hypothetical protein